MADDATLQSCDADGNEDHEGSPEAQTQDECPTADTKAQSVPPATKARTKPDETK